MSERRDLMWREWEKQWKDYPSQDNEGYQPDRGSYKAGFLDGFKTADANPPHENGTNTKDVSPEKGTNPPAPSSDDERDAEEYVNNKFANSLPALKNAMAEIFIAGRKGMVPIGAESKEWMKIFADFRKDIRNALYDKGIRSNPGWSEDDIVNAVKSLVPASEVERLVGSRLADEIVKMQSILDKLVAEAVRSERDRCLDALVHVDPGIEWSGGGSREYYAYILNPPQGSDKE